MAGLDDDGLLVDRYCDRRVIGSGMLAFIKALLGLSHAVDSHGVVWEADHCPAVGRRGLGLVQAGRGAGAHELGEVSSGAVPPPARGNEHVLCFWALHHH
eukprot:scaffold144315_cov46-Prasinocladus_malaysianus.AAC.1